jgi:hypothetical protein
MGVDVLSRRALNRATLERQLLLRRVTTPVVDTVQHLVGMQAQLPLNPYVGLWSRIEGFGTDDLAQPLVDRRLVRTVVMRGTIHLVTADDCLLLRPLMQPVLDAELARHPEHAPHLRSIELAPALAFARRLLAEQPLDGTRLRAALAEAFPELDAAALAYACRNHLALVQVPPRGVWGRSAQVVSTTAEAWLGRPLVAEPSIDEVVLRYLAAFGPAAPADAAAWSRLTGLREVFERLRPRLRPFRDERGREVFDLPDAPRPDSDTPAPARFLPEYENLLLSHADRSRFFAEDPGHPWDLPPAPFRGTATHDGIVRATWAIERASKADQPMMVLRPSPATTNEALAELTDEARRLLAFVEPGATSVRVDGPR